jgi:hypothetical protein
MKISLVRAKDPGVDLMMPVLGWAAFRNAFSFSLPQRDSKFSRPNTRGCKSAGCWWSKMAAAADSCLFPSPHLNHNESPRPSYTVRDKPQWPLLWYRRMMSLTQGDALDNDIEEAAAALTAVLREFPRWLGRMESWAVIRGSATTNSSIRLGARAQ